MIFSIDSQGTVVQREWDKSELHNRIEEFIEGPRHTLDIDTDHLPRIIDKFFGMSVPSKAQMIINDNNMNLAAPKNKPASVFFQDTLSKMGSMKKFSKEKLEESSKIKGSVVILTNEDRIKS